MLKQAMQIEGFMLTHGQKERSSTVTLLSVDTAEFTDRLRSTGQTTPA